MNIRIDFEQPEKPQKYGKIFVGDAWFANCFTYDSDPCLGALSGKVIFNRHTPALEMELPSPEHGFSTHAEMLEWLERALVGRQLPEIAGLALNRPGQGRGG